MAIPARAAITSAPSAKPSLRMIQSVNADHAVSENILENATERTGHETRKTVDGFHFPMPQIVARPPSLRSLLRRGVVSDTCAITPETLGTPSRHKLHGNSVCR